MQGKKIYQEKLFNSFRLSERVPETNFYRRLKSVLDLTFLYNKTKCYYGNTGQKSIDPIVFFKLCLVGYLENIISDRRLIAHCSMRMDILYFLGYDIDEELPWHSTLSRTRQLYPEIVFEEVFSHVVKICVDQGMVSGHTQAIDSAPIKANASMDSLDLKVPEEDLESYLREIRHISSVDRHKPLRQARKDKARPEQKTLTATSQELQSIKSRQKKWSKDQDQRPGAKNKGSKYTSNKTHYSPTDPDARISVKPGKARKLNYHSHISVDTSHHIITDMQAYHADKKDNQYLQDIVTRTKDRLWSQGFTMKRVLADAGYSSGENYAYLEREGIESYIPKHGTYKGGPEGFTYQGMGNYWLCPQGKAVKFRKQKTEKATLKDLYLTTRKDCRGCHIKTACIDKQHEKRISITAYRAEYERNNTRVNSRRGKRMKNKRLSTVEPVFGTLTQFMGLRKINTIGIEQANKVMHLSATAYNLKKYVNFIFKQIGTQAKAICFYFFVQTLLNWLEIKQYKPIKL